MTTARTSPTGRRAEALDRRHIERRELNARRLLPAVERLLEHRSYADLSVDEMVAEADISRSTFYNYFEDKGDLLRALTGDVMSSITDATRMWWMLAPNASRDDLRLAIGHLFAMYTPHGPLMRAVAESTVHDEGVRQEFLGYMREGAAGIEDYIRRGQQVGALRSEIEPALAAEWLVWMFERGLAQLSRDVDGRDPARIVAAATDILWGSLH